MKILMYSTRSYDKIVFREVLQNYENVTIDFLESSLNSITVDNAKGYDAICVFVNDKVTKEILDKLHLYGVRLILARCVGKNNIDEEAAANYQIEVKNVPAYSPESVAEHALALLMAVNRNIHKAYQRVKDNNFSLTALSGYCLSEKTVGIIGLGRIGQAFARICYGLGMKVIAYDPVFTEKSANITLPGTESISFKVDMVSLDEIYKNSDVISLHLPLMKKTKHMIDAAAMEKMKKDVILINVSRGGLIDTDALITYNEKGKFFGIGLDVFEGEEGVLYKNHEDDIVFNPVVQKLLSARNVIVTAHQAFLTKEALHEIAVKTIENSLE